MPWIAAACMPADKAASSKLRAARAAGIANFIAICDEFAGCVLLCRPLFGVLGSEPPPILPPPPHPAIRIIPAAETAAVALRASIVVTLSRRRALALVTACAAAHLPRGPSSFNRAGLVKRVLVTFRTTPPFGTNVLYEFPPPDRRAGGDPGRGAACMPPHRDRHRPHRYAATSAYTRRRTTTAT